MLITVILFVAVIMVSLSESLDAGFGRLTFWIFRIGNCSSISIRESRNSVPEDIPASRTSVAEETFGADVVAVG